MATTKYKWPTEVPVLKAANFVCGGGGKLGRPPVHDGIEIEGCRQNCLMEYANIVFCPKRVWAAKPSWLADAYLDEVPDEVYVALAEACGAGDLVNCLQEYIVNFNDACSTTMQDNADAWNAAMKLLGYTEISYLTT